MFVIQKVISLIIYLSQLIEKVSVNNSENIDKMLWEREKDWQAQLFTLTHGFDSPNEWYAQNRWGHKK